MTRSSVKVVQEYVKKYERIDEVLRGNPQILTLAHTDFTYWLNQSQQGREGDYTSEQIFRSILVMFIEQQKLSMIWQFPRFAVGTPVSNAVFHVFFIDDILFFRIPKNRLARHAGHIA